MEYHLDIKMNEIFTFTDTRMDLEGTMVHEMSDRERQILYDITYVESLNNKLVNKTTKKQTHRYREQTNSYQWGGGEGRKEGQYWDRKEKSYYEII